VAHYAYVLDRGRIVMQGNGPSLLNNPQVTQTYLGGKAE
jgi:ABC-type branched-subunit amino acid transport system ATPase component